MMRHRIALLLRRLAARVDDHSTDASVTLPFYTAGTGSSCNATAVTWHLVR